MKSGRGHRSGEVGVRVWLLQARRSPDGTKSFSVRVEGGAASAPMAHPSSSLDPTPDVRRWDGEGVEGSWVVPSWGADPSPGWLPTHFLIGTRTTEAQRTLRGLAWPLPSCQVKPSERPCSQPADVGGGGWRRGRWGQSQGPLGTSPSVLQGGPTMAALLPTNSLTPFPCSASRASQGPPGFCQLRPLLPWLDQVPAALPGPWL